MESFEVLDCSSPSYRSNSLSLSDKVWCSFCSIVYSLKLNTKLNKIFAVKLSSVGHSGFTISTNRCVFLACQEPTNLN